jgi:hypothetical protein
MECGPSNEHPAVATGTAEMIDDAHDDDGGSLRELHAELERSVARHQSSPNKRLEMGQTTSAGILLFVCKPESIHLPMNMISCVDVLLRSVLNGVLTTAASDYMLVVCLTPDAKPVIAPSLVPLDLWVSKWVDYSEKYGLGYLLSNGACGVYFNDSSRIILSPDSMYDVSRGGAAL